MLFNPINTFVIYIISILAICYCSFLYILYTFLQYDENIDSLLTLMSNSWKYKIYQWKYWHVYEIFMIWFFFFFFLREGINHKLTQPKHLNNQILKLRWLPNSKRVPQQLSCQFDDIRLKSSSFRRHITTTQLYLVWHNYCCLIKN